MSIQKPYRIMNKLAGLAMFLSRDTHKDIVGEYVEPGARQTWIIEYLREVGPGGHVEAHIKSKANGQYVSFEGPPREGVDIIVSDTAKVWDIIPDHQPDYKIKLHGTNWVLAFTRENIHPGMPLILQKEKVPEDINQVWVLTPQP